MWTHTEQHRERENSWIFFYLSDSNRCHKTKIRLKKKSVYATKTYFTTDQRYLPQRATQHKKSLHIQQQHGNMLTCLNVSKSRQDSHKLKQKLKNKELWHLHYVSFYLKLLSESSRKSAHVKKKKKNPSHPLHLCRTFTFSICFMIKNFIFYENYAKQWSRQGGSTVNKKQTWQVQTLPVQYLCLSQLFLRPSYCFWPLQLYRDLFAIKDRGGGSRHQQVAVYSWVKLCRNKVTHVLSCDQTTLLAFAPASIWRAANQNERQRWFELRNYVEPI